MSNSAEISSPRLNLGQQLQAFGRFKASFPRWVGNMAVNFFKDSFRRQGWIDQGYQKWPERVKNETTGKKKAKRAILVKSGQLRRSIRVIRSGLGYVVVGSNLPYARIHNEGGFIRTVQQIPSFHRKAFVRTWKKKKQKVSPARVKSHSRKVNTEIKQRQFIGPSHFLNRRILMNADYRLNQILNT